MNVYEKESLVVEEIGYEELYEALSRWIGTWELEQALDDIINTYDIAVPEPEDDYTPDTEE